MSAGGCPQNSVQTTLASSTAWTQSGHPDQKEQQKFRVRIRFRKVGNLRWIGHLDLVRTIERVFRRCGVRFATSQGYHPKPLMIFPSPLPLGIEGWNEVGEVILADVVKLDWLLDELNQKSVEGLEFLSLRHLPASAPKPRLVWCIYHLAVNSDLQMRLSAELERLNCLDHWPLRHGRHGQMLNLKDHLKAVRLHEDQLWLCVRPSESGGPTIREVLSLLTLGDYEKAGGVVVRAAVLLADEDLGQESPARDDTWGLWSTFINAGYP